MYLRNLTDNSHELTNSDSEWHSPAFEAFDPVEEITASDDFISLMTIETDDNLLLEDVRALLLEYKDIFSETLTAEPADLPPLELTVDKSMWERPKHHSAPRPQTSINQAEIKSH